MDLTCTAKSALTHRDGHDTSGGTVKSDFRLAWWPGLQKCAVINMQSRTKEIVSPSGKNSAVLLKAIIS